MKPVLFLSFMIAALGGDQSVDGMIYIPEGPFLSGSATEEVARVAGLYGKREAFRNHPFAREAPSRKINLKAFYIDRHEVTNRQYRAFIDATGHRPPLHWANGRYEAGRDDYPVTYVSHDDAAAYANWAGKRLPTALEWEKAARGPDGRIYPWGDGFDPYKAVTAESDLTALLDALCFMAGGAKVEAVPADVSPYGVHDMGGNVREWTATPDGEDPGYRIVKGGSWVDLAVNARAAHQERAPRTGVSHIIGFRCVRDGKGP